MKENISCILANTRKTSHIPVWETSTSHERYCTNRGDPLQESLPIRVAWFTAAAALVATFTLMGSGPFAWPWRTTGSARRPCPAPKKRSAWNPTAPATYVRLAAIIQESNPVASTEALQRAVALNRWDSQSWVELGLRAEVAGDLAAAERSLLRAASVDLQYLPSWSLVNYYFRRGDSERFWFWARQATQMAYGDLAPLFTLCWKVTSDGALIEQKLDIHKADLEANYLTYLTNQNRIEPMTHAATRLLAWNREADTPVLLAACDRLIADDRAGQAIRIWNKLAELHRIPYPVLAPDSGRSLTNGDFTMLPMSQGFDWRLPGVGGVAPLLDERPAGLRISFSGRQPENCDVLNQFRRIRAGALLEAVGRGEFVLHGLRSRALQYVVFDTPPCRVSRQLRILRVRRGRSRVTHRYPVTASESHHSRSHGLCPAGIRAIRRQAYGLRLAPSVGVLR